ncbi:alpha/beta hydrolase [Streptomyces violascens]|uniref:Alpha/beta hydrolase n=1 Tax=Streptomyces violascens TaxID=67381 RepID=A0ABQ3QRT0_9ACTN|nr:alpha/beta hydrolase [Streptomyces violascens]GGT84969.1 alpha/beta hydrolase [Streptomyces violascens]GHI39978.1 alpha/beta hydrolase [Streptomyces violascens]
MAAQGLSYEKIGGRTMRESVLEVPGARLRYAVRGEGPLLLLVAGGHHGVDANEPLACHLADRYTVLTYDRRGLSGSTTDAPATTLTTHADDVSRLLSHLTPEPALVYGTSLGALISLELTVRHPGQVAAVVAHEPPVTQLLSEPGRALALGQLLTVEETFRAEGAAPAMRRFAADIDIDPNDCEPDVPPRAPGPDHLRNAEVLLTHDMPAIRSHVLDVAALKDSPARVVPAAGENSGHIWPHACAAMLADELGTPLQTFPGGHNGYVFHPCGTAERIRTVFGS